MTKTMNTSKKADQPRMAQTVIPPRKHQAALWNPKTWFITLLSSQTTIAHNNHQHNNHQRSLRPELIYTPPHTLTNHQLTPHFHQTLIRLLSYVHVFEGHLEDFTEAHI
ncbi:hypothetical protein GP473_03935 [Corynebacterium anserum]|uniref:Uncharacterized protein n=1 Tax=Corynebacterium anserum TaxID=2684406 RepID=A0A7G7YN71_9CORY|nr:hypothetical protein GP473_03935 [Corynebacterium anserum]